MSYTPKKDMDLSGDPTAPTQTSTDNDTSIATTGFVQDAILNAHTHGEQVQVFTATGTISSTTGHIVTFAGAASQTLTLPAASVGQWYEVLNIDGSDVVSVARAGSDTINGGTSVDVGPGDKAKIVCTATNTWIAIFDRFPWKARIGLTAAANHTSNGAFQKVAAGGTWAASYDVRPNGATAQADDTTNMRIDIQRSGLYLVQGNVTFTGIGTSTTVTAGQISVDGTARNRAFGYAHTTAAGRSHHMSGTGGLAAGSYVELYAYQNESSSEAYGYEGASYLHDTFLSVQWLGPNGSG